MSRSASVTPRSRCAPDHANAHHGDGTPSVLASKAAHSAANARYGHRFSQIAVFPPPIQREAEDGEELQRKAEGSPVARPDVPVASGGGSPLSVPVLGKMERSFGHSFSDVRIHHGDEARQVGALAYTRGCDIHFQPGLYSPDSLSGQELLGHELTHVVQQKSGRVSAPQNKSAGTAPINADAGLEGEADALGARAARGEAVRVQGASGGGLQCKADIVQRWPWSKAKDLSDTAGTWAGYGTDLGGTGAAAAAAAQDWQGASNSWQSIATAPSSISKGDMAGGGIGMLGALSLPGTAINTGQGFKDIYKGAKTGDARRGMEGAGAALSGMTSMAGTLSGMVQGGAFLSHAAGLAGTAGAAAAPLGLVTSTLGLGKSMYQGITAHQKRKDLEGVSGGIDGTTSPELKAAADFAMDVQRKRRNRAGINTASNALIAGGSAAALAGAAGAGVGAAVGVGLAGAGMGLKYGSLAARTLKQSSRDAAAKRAEDKAGGRKLGLWDRSVGSLSDRIFNPNTEKTTAKKNAAYTTHIATIMSDKTVGAQIFAGLGATKSDLKKFEEYHVLRAAPPPLATADAERLAKLEERLKGRIADELKRRE